MADEKKTEAPVSTGKMKVADVQFNLAKDGFHIHLNGVTPAELMLLLAEHSANAGGKCLSTDDNSNAIKLGMSISILDENGKQVLKDGVPLTKRVMEVERTPSEEVKRLRGKYAGNKISALFPGASPNLPATFEEAIASGPSAVLPTSKLTEVKLA